MKCLNTRAKLTIQKLYEAMYQKPYMIEEGIYARIDNNPNYMPVVIEKSGISTAMGKSSASPTTANKTATPWPTPTWNSSS